MKRALLFIFMTVCVLGMSACSSKDAMPETSDSASNPVQNTDISNLNGGKIWSEQDIVSMFSLVQETDWEYISVATVNRWENGRTEPNKMTLFVIRDFCKSKNIAFAFDTSKSVERGEQN